MIVADEVMLNEVKKEVDFMVSKALSKFPETPSSSSLFSEYYEATPTSSISSILLGIACRMDAMRATSSWSIAQVRQFSFTITLNRYTALLWALRHPTKRSKRLRPASRGASSDRPPEYLVPDCCGVQICLDTVYCAR